MKLFIRSYGNANDPSIIILHGLLGVSDHWVSFGKKIAELGFHVLIPDLRNHGQSPHSKIFTYNAMADDLKEFVTQNDIKKAIILGHSMGGKLAMSFTLLNPELVEKLCVVDISMRSYTNSNPFVMYFDLMQSIDFSKVESRIDVEKILSTKIVDMHIIQFLMKNLQRLDKNKFGWKIDLESIRLNFNNISSTLNFKNVFTNPSLFIRGSKSDYILDDDKTLLKKNFPNSEFVDVPDATHWVQVDQPEIFFNIFKNFIL